MNLVAILPGTEQPEKRIIVSAHYDSINLRASLAKAPKAAEAPAPGADDDASGTAVVLELARVMSQYRFRKTIVFIAFAGEELGYIGSSHYASRAKANHEQIEAVFAHELGHVVHKHMAWLVVFFVVLTLLVVAGGAWIEKWMGNAGIKEGPAQGIEARAGEFVWREPGSRHVAWCPEGGLMLAIFQVPNKFFEKDGRVVDAAGHDWDETWGHTGKVAGQ